MADLKSHYIPGLMPHVGVMPGASKQELVSAACGLLAGAIDILQRDDMTPQEWAGMAALGLAQAFLQEAGEKSHG